VTSILEAFYDGGRRPPADRSDVLVLSADGKGIVMQTAALRSATAEAASRTTSM
jgi:hypothetical protein